jgi:hypothetical protein
MTKSNLNSWLKDNSWNLLLTTVGIIMAFTVANMRINAMETKVAEYPSYDYFELKFQTVEKNIAELKTTLNAHMGIK